MNKQFSILLCFAVVITLLGGCKKDEEEKKINVEFSITPFPSSGSSSINPTTTPYLVFSKRINFGYFDQTSGKVYKIVIDSSYITNSQSALIPYQKKYSLNKDTLKFIPSNDFPSNEAYKLNLTYHVEVKNDKTYTYDVYVMKGVPQTFQFESNFSTSDYPYFDPSFVATAHPAAGSTLNCLLNPYFTFSHKIDFLYLNAELNRNYKICIDSAGLYASNFQSLPSNVVYGSLKDTLRIKPTNLLDGSSEYKLKLKYHIEVKGKNTETFQILKKDGTPYYGRVTSSFCTISQTSAIDTSYIEYAYPSPYQYHFLKNETTRGVLKLKTISKSRSNGKVILNATGSTFKVRFSTLTGQSWTSDATYNSSEQKFVFQIPSSNLENQMIYKIEYIMVNGGIETAFLTYHFRTSKFNTFEEKLNSESNAVSILYAISEHLDYPGRRFDMQEPFDNAEGKRFNGLVRFEALSDRSCKWFYDLDSLFYSGLKTSQFKIQWRSNKLINTPPTNAIFFKSEYLAPLLSQEQIVNGVAESRNSGRQEALYCLTYYCQKDYNDIYTQISNAINSNKPLNDWEKGFLRVPYYELYFFTNYNLNIKYVCGDIVTTTKKWIIRL